MISKNINVSNRPKDPLILPSNAKGHAKGHDDDMALIRKQTKKAKRKYLENGHILCESRRLHQSENSRQSNHTNHAEYIALSLVPFTENAESQFHPKWEHCCKVDQIESVPKEDT